MKKVGAFVAGLALALGFSLGAGSQETQPSPGFTRQMPLSLAQAKEIALANNPDLRSERLNLEMAGVDVVRAKATYDPYLQLDTSYSSNESASAESVLVGTSNKSLSLNMSSGITTITGGSLSLGFSNSRSESNSIFTTLNPSYNTSLSLNLRQPLLKNRYSDERKLDLEQRENDLKSAEYSLKSRTLDLTSQVEDAYWTLVKDRLDQEVRRQSLQTAQHLFDLTQAQVKTGLTAPVNTIQSRANRASAQSSLIRAQNDYRRDQTNFKLILNLSVEEGLWDLELLPTDSPPKLNQEINPQEVLEQALMNNINLNQLRYNIANTEIQNAQTKNRLLPQLDMRTSIGISGLAGTSSSQPYTVPTGFVIPNPFPTPPPYMLELTTATPAANSNEGDYGTALTNLGRGNNLNWSAGLTFNMPIGNRAAQSDWKRARLSFERLKIQQAQQERNVVFTVQNLLNDFDAARRNLEAASLAADLQQQNLDTEQKRFELGLSTQYNVMQAQASSNDAKTAAISSQIELAKAMARIDRAEQGYLSAGGLNFSLPSGLASGLNLGSISSGLPAGISPSLIQQYSSMLPAGFDLNSLKALGINLP